MAVKQQARNLCRCGCGDQVRGIWARGHASRGPGGYHRQREPAPDYDLGELGPDAGPGSMPDMPAGGEDWTPTPDELEAWKEMHEGPGGGDPDELGPDPAPGSPIGEPGAAAAVPIRVTRAIRREIDAKLGLILEVPARIWEARDPLCGGAFVAQLPAIRSAWVNFICNSPRLLAFFTSGDLGFIMWLELAFAMQPVLSVVFAHHVLHSIKLPDPAANGQAPAAGDPAYAA